MAAHQRKFAVITGASQGIGRAFALALGRRGGHVLLGARHTEALEAVAEEVAHAGGEALTRHLDLTDAQSIGAFTEFIGDRLPRLDLLINCAGAYARGGIEELTGERFDALYQTNVRGPLVLTQALLPALKASRGDIVFMNSSAIFGSGAGVGGYASTRHALKGLTDALRSEVNADGVRVLSVYPGRTNTPLQEAIFAAEGRDYDPARLLQPEDVVSTVLHCIDLPETAEVTELQIRPRLNHRR
ncbi:SDR family NAD(P)-dependent oxidoreductase [Halofilum ochraceum]|uniref:SDR family NAD(P)-dependent oxidoreductase n=1 Tax=Halofilum ochraceum TaxID=1611323 RepID=UPI0008377908|nr:SDR family NAD(P)-dependent oxidoreductase [Halofilum ochraceum]